MSSSYVTIHCDGSSLGNPGPAGGGAVLWYNGVTKDVSFQLGHTTNNRAEVLAIIHSLRQLKRPCRVIIHSDSQYAVYGASGEHKRKVNKDLWALLDNEVDKHIEVRFQWVPRQMNVKADKLAFNAAKAQANRSKQNDQI